MMAVPRPPSRRLRKGLVGLALWSAAAALLAVLTRDGAAFSASAAPWLDSLQAPQSIGWPKLLRAALDRMPPQWREDPLWGLRWLQLVLGATGLVLALAVARRASSRLGGGLAVVLVLAWLPARLALQTVGVESVWATSLLALVWAAQSWSSAPWRAALAASAGAWAIAATHPLGVVLAPIGLLSILLLPLTQHRAQVHAHSPTAAAAPGEPVAVSSRASQLAEPSRVGFAVGARWLAWLAAVLMAVGWLAVSLRPEPLKAWGAAQFAVLRQPCDAPQPGPWMMPLIGPCLVWLAQIPIGMVLLGWTGLRSLRRAWHDPAAALVAVVAATVAVLAACGYPYPTSLDPLVAMAPLCATAAAIAAARGMQALIGQYRPVAAVAWAATLAVLLAVDLAGMRAADCRNVLARRLIATVHRLQPATLDLDDLALAQRFAEPVAVLPSLAGGQPLALAALPLAARGRPWGAAVARPVAPHAARLLLLPEPPREEADRLWAGTATQIACRADRTRCVYRLVGRGAAPARAAR